MLEDHAVPLVFWLSLKSCNHFPEKHGKVATVCSIADKIAAPFVIPEGKDQQHKSGFSIFSFSRSVELLVQHRGDGIHSLVEPLFYRCVAEFVIAHGTTHPLGVDA